MIWIKLGTGAESDATKNLSLAGTMQDVSIRLIGPHSMMSITHDTEHIIL